jgi:hypothetical protein
MNIVQYLSAHVPIGCLFGGVKGFFKSHLRHCREGNCMTLTKRTASRKPTNKAGVIKLGDREVTVVLRDISASGARLRPVGSNIEVPDRFQLVAPMEKIDVTCVVVWRRGHDIGVKFEA